MPKLCRKVSPFHKVLAVSAVSASLMLPFFCIFRDSRLRLLDTVILDFVIGLVVSRIGREEEFFSKIKNVNNVPFLFFLLFLLRTWILG